MRLQAEQVIADRYRLIERVGAGGMAEVWCAEDTMLDRRVALKFLHERFAQDAQFVERFRREASSAAGLQHPNVVGVFDRGEHEGVQFIAMEYIEGASLKDLIARGLSVGEAVEIIRQVLAGARFAHGRGIVHRDLKPQNVLIDADGRARVADFGIARAGVSEITQTGSVMGTAQYLSPEQAQGLPVTPASDLYSIGVMLYEALTGRVPFEGDSAVTVALKQVSERPRPPSELNPAVPPALDSVVLRALAKDPVNRFASANEFLAGLDAAEADPSAADIGDTDSYAALPPVAAPPPPPMRPPFDEEPRPGFWTRGRIALLVGLLLLGGGVAAYALTRPQQVNVPTVLNRDADTATDILRGRGFDVTQVTRPNCVAAGLVTEQDPPPGSQVDEGSTVTLTVSTGMTVKVPQVAGLPASKAQGELQKSDLLVDAKKRASSRQANHAIGTEPAAGEEVACKSPVTLLISSGPDLVEVPDVTGLQRDFAESQLEGAGLEVNVVSRDADETEGEVIDQNPPAGTEVKEGSEVTIAVSTGAGSVVVRDVVGQTKDAAKAALKSLGLTVQVERESTTDPSVDGRVVDQAPPPGTRVRTGDTVTIFVAKLVDDGSTTSTSTAP